MAKSWFQVCKDAIEMYRNRDKYAYFYGSKGQKLTKATMDALWSAEPGHFKKYSAAEKEQIYRNSLNKIGYDCSGFVCKVTGETGYSKSIYDKRTKETTMADGPAGSFLFTTWGGAGRHIGLDIGLGFCMDMAYESTDANVAAHRDSVRLSRVADVAWEHSFQTAAVNYNGAYATDPNNKPTPTPTPTPTTKVGQATTAVNLRVGPGVNYAVCNVDRNDGKGSRHILYEGEKAEIISQSGNWYQLTISGKVEVWKPWVCKDYIKLV